MNIGTKIFATGVLFIFIGLLAVAIRVRDDRIGDTYKIFFGLCISGGGVAVVVGALIFIWS